MSDFLTVSVIIPTYNTARFIGRAIESVRRQTEQNYEIIVCDDRSSDETCDIVAAMAAQDKRIRLLTTETNGGPGAARNRGIDSARGRWLAFLDADDRWKPDRLRSLIGLAESNALDIVVDNYTTFDESTGVESEPVLMPATPTVPLNVGTMIMSERPSGWVRLGLLKPILRREFLNDRHIRYATEIRYAEDFHLLMRALLEGGKGSLVRDAHYIYTLPSSPATGVKSGGSRTTPRLSERVWVADDLLARYATANQHTVCLLKQYKRWMTDINDGYEGLRLWREGRHLASIAHIATRPRGAWAYAISCPTAKMLRRRFRPFSDDMRWAASESA